MSQSQSQLKFKITKRVFNETYYPHLQQYDTRFNIFYGGAGSG